MNLPYPMFFASALPSWWCYWLLWNCSRSHPSKKPPKTMLGQFIPTDKTISSEPLGRSFWMLPGSTPSLYSKANCTERPWNLQRQVLKATPASFLNLFLSVCLTKSKHQFLRQGSFNHLKIVLEQTQLPIKPKFTYRFSPTGSFQDLLLMEFLIIKLGLISGCSLM